MKKHLLSISLLIASLFISDLEAKKSRPTDIKSMMESSRNLNIDFVDFLFMDITGHLKSVTLPTDKIQGAFEKGIFFDGSSILGYTSINASDLLAKADLGSSFLQPWNNDLKGAYVFCDVYSSSTQPYKHCPRNVLKKALQRANDAGFEPAAGIELEFYLFKKGVDGALVPVDNNVYCDAISDVQLDTFKNSLLYLLDTAGIEVEKAHHEVAPGQYEIVLRYGNPLLIADSLILAKHIMRSFAQMNGYEISFMPKPIAGVNGTGMHIHMSMQDTETKKNAFYDATKLYSLSDTARHFIAGNLEHLRDMTLLLNSSVNSYKRLVPGYEAPVYLSWGFKNRSTAIRIPETNPEELIETDGAPVRMEFRSPDPCCNPYFVFASIIHAGLDGIEKKTIATDSVEQNLYKSTAEEREALNIKTIPHSLGDSLEVFRDSTFMKETFGESLHAKLISLSENNWKDYSLTEEHNPLIISEWEKNYHNII
ncbi:MAG: glutamine synthetase [Alteromonas naphthalenivorans]